VKDKILALRAAGRTYNEIAAELGVSKGSISYHCGEGQKDKTRRRRIAARKMAHPLTRKIENFCLDFRRSRTTHKLLYRKMVSFCREKTGKFTSDMATFTIPQLLEKIGDDPKCALTGRPVDLLDASSYALDHVVPRAKGGANSLDNCQLVCSAANQAKHDMLQDEFVKLCEEVVAHAQRQKYLPLEAYTGKCGT
jgi:5-methylcytosine-specific restriction endonuclease McrA